MLIFIPLMMRNVFNGGIIFKVNEYGNMNYLLDLMDKNFKRKQKD